MKCRFQFPSLSLGLHLYLFPFLAVFIHYHYSLRFFLSSRFLPGYGFPSLSSSYICFHIILIYLLFHFLYVSFYFYFPFLLLSSLRSFIFFCFLPILFYCFAFSLFFHFLHVLSSPLHFLPPLSLVSLFSPSQKNSCYPLSSCSPSSSTFHLFRFQFCSSSVISPLFVSSSFYFLLFL